MGLLLIRSFCTCFINAVVARGCKTRCLIPLDLKQVGLKLGRPYSVSSFLRGLTHGLPKHFVSFLQWHFMKAESCSAIKFIAGQKCSYAIMSAHLVWLRLDAARGFVAGLAFTRLHGSSA